MPDQPTAAVLTEMYVKSLTVILQWKQSGAERQEGNPLEKKGGGVQYKGGGQRDKKKVMENSL